MKKVIPNFICKVLFAISFCCILLVATPFLALSQNSITPDNWGFWSESNLRASSATSVSPVFHRQVRVYNEKQWALTAPSYPVNPGEVKVFSAVISGRYLGELSPGGVAYIGMVTLNNQGIVEWNPAIAELPKGTFGWMKISVKYTVPSNGSVTKIQPRFFAGNGGGELYVTDAAFSTENSELGLIVPQASIPFSSVNLSPIIQNTPTEDLPLGWSFWSQSDLRASSAYYDKPVPHIEARVYNDEQWALNAHALEVKPGERWTFTAVVSGRYLGELSNGGVANIGMVTLNSQGGIVEWNPVVASLPKGTFGWTRVSVSYTIPSNGMVTKIQPRFFSGGGGGELYVANACCLPSGNPANLFVPSLDFPQSKVNLSNFINNAETLTPLTGWNFWQEGKYEDYVISLPQRPSPSTKVEIAHNRSWSLSSVPYPVQPGETWTFTALVTGQFIQQSSVHIGMVTVNSLGGVEDWNAVIKPLPTGAFDWTKISVTYHVPEDGSISSIIPRFFAADGKGYVFITAAAFLPTSNPANLSRIISLDNIIPKEDPTNSYSKYGIYLPNQTITWNVPNQLNLVATSLKYNILDAYDQPIVQNGNIISGEIQLGQTLSFVPNTCGYYQLRITGKGYNSITNEPLTISGFSSAVVINNFSARFGSNPFSVQSLPDDLYSRLGLSWERLGSYNILNVGKDNYKDLPEPNELVTYRQKWTEITTTGDLGNGENINNSKYINSIGIWNEPTNEKAFENGKTYQDFLAMLKASYEGIKAANPSKLVLLNLEHPQSFTAMNNLTIDGHKGSGYYDIMSIHPYTMGSYEGYSICPEASYPSRILYDEHGNPKKDENGNTVTVDNYGEPILTTIERYRQVEPKKPLWTTEFGWPTTPNYSSSTPLLEQARYIVRSAVLQLSAGVKKLSVFRWGEVRDDGDFDGSFGLNQLVENTSDYFNPYYIPKPAVAAFSVLAQTIHDLPYYGYVNQETNLGFLVFGDNSRSRSKKTVLVLWRPDREGIISLVSLSGETSIVDMFGRTSKTTLPILSQSIGKSPIYIVIDKNPNEVFGSFPQVIKSIPPAALFNVGKGY